jgi:hypothetical protein
MQLMYQLLEAIEKSGERRFYHNKCPEVQRLGELVVDEIIACQFRGEDKNDDSIRHAATSLIIQHIQLYIRANPSPKPPPKS